MKSTRSNLQVQPAQAILHGLSPDGGLFVWDQLPESLFQTLDRNMTYKELAITIFETLLSDYSKQDIHAMIDKAYGAHHFPNQIAPVTPFESHAYLELYHGPTFAFKDMALSMLPQLLSTAKRQYNITKPTVILTATSGDTGSAALSGFQELPNTHVIVLYPDQGVSPFQEQQMNSFQSETNTILAVDGNFDDCQRIVKQVFQEYHPNHVLLTSANSINIGRILPQIVYYFHGYFELVRQENISYGELINITVPTGNFGNIYAAYLATKMGLPVHKLLIASNQNNVLTDCFHNAQYDINRTLHQTISPSMDIVVSSNLERYLYDLYEEDAATITAMMDTLKQDSVVSLPNINPKGLFVADFATEEDTLREIRSTFDTNQYLIDPHTAVARFVTRTYQEHSGDATYSLIVSTASPYKFSDAIINALELTSSASLETTFKRIEQHTNHPIDPRIAKLLHQTTSKQQVPLENAVATILRKIGDIQ